MVREISLTQNKVALVDDDDFIWLSQSKWYAIRAPRVHGEPEFYAGRTLNIRHGGRHTTRMILMHREIIGAPSGQDVDHRDGNGLNNQRENIRSCSKSQNSANRVRRIPNPSSRFRGVTFHRQTGKWQAAIRIQGRSQYLGLFADEETAARAHDHAAVAGFGEFARLNFPEVPV